MIYKFVCYRDCNRHGVCSEPCDIILKSLPSVRKGYVRHSIAYNDRTTNSAAPVYQEPEPRQPVDFSVISDIKLRVIALAINAQISKADIADLLHISIRQLNRILADAIKKPDSG